MNVPISIPNDLINNNVCGSLANKKFNGISNTPRITN